MWLIIMQHLLLSYENYWMSCQNTKKETDVHICLFYSFVVFLFVCSYIIFWWHLFCVWQLLALSMSVGFFLTFFLNHICLSEEIFSFNYHRSPNQPLRTIHLCQHTLYPFRLTRVPFLTRHFTDNSSIINFFNKPTQRLNFNKDHSNVKTIL